MGSSMAMVGTGPMPGRTPMSVPSATPTKQYARLAGVTAVWKPSARFASSSTSAPEEGRPEVHGHLEPPHEHRQAEQGQPGAEEEHLDPAEAGRGGAAQDHHQH